MLLTGFEPFAGDQTNPSGDAVVRLGAAWNGPARLVTAVLPVDFARAGWMFLVPQKVQDKLARSCDASMVPSEAGCEFRKILLMPLHDQCA